LPRLSDILHQISRYLSKSNTIINKKRENLLFVNKEGRELAMSIWHRVMQINLFFK